MKNWKRKYTSILLTVVMVAVILMPMFSATPVFAATTRCGISANWQIHTSTSSLPTNGYYYFDRNWGWTYGNNTNLKVNGTLYLDLNGKTLTLKGTSTYAAIDIYNGSKLYLYDSVGTGKIIMQSDAQFVQAVYVSGTNSLFQMNGGTISGFTKASSGGAVRVVSGGKFEMKGGTISNCTASTGGGAVSVENASTFDMSGGTIQDCQATGTVSNTGLGGAVSIASGATFNMTGGTIQKCTSSRYGGGIDSYGTFNMSGGSIDKCTSGQTGGGIYIEAGTVNISRSAKITNCYSATYGGGIGTYKNAILNISGGEISGNSNKSGHEIYVYGSGAKAYITGGIVSGEIYPYSSGAAYASGYCTLSNFRGTNNGTKTAITFDKQGGTGGTNSVDPATWNTAMPNATMPTRTGYTFAGYWDAASGGAQYYNANGTSTRNWNKIVAATTLYAHWTPNTYTIKFDKVLGTGTADNITAIYDQSYTLPAAPTLVGYTFAGWSTGGKKYDAGASVNNLTTVNEGSVTLVAQWTANTYTVTFDDNGGTDAPSKLTATYNKDFTLSNITPTRTGYIFSGWNTEQNGTGTTYAAAASVKNLATSGTVTLYAQWTPNTYTVTLNNGESVENSSATATYNEYLPDVTVPTWENHVFEGYFTEADGKGEKYIDKEGKGVKAWNITSDTTLYAFWKESAKVESMDLTLGGDIGMRYHVAVNDPELQETGTMTVSIGGKKAFTETKNYSEVDKDNTGAILFPFNVSSIQLAEKVKVEFKDKDGKVIASESKSVEDYYNLVNASESVSADQKEMVRTLVDYGYYAQQALSKTRGWEIGKDYAESKKYGSLTSTKDDLKAYKPVISGKDANVRDIQLSLLLDNKTTLCVYVLTADKKQPTVKVDGEEVTPEDNEEGWWLVKIEDIDALNLSTMYTVEVGGYTVYLSALSYASVASDAATIEAMRALRDYYEATLKANGKTALTSATVEENEYEYTGEAIVPSLTVMAGDEPVTDYKIEWNGDLINAGTYTGLVTKDGYVGGVTVKVTITPKSVTAPKPVNATLTYNGEEQTGVVGSETPVNGPMKAPAMNVVPEEPGYTLYGNTAIDAGKYTARAMLTDAVNYCWDDGTTTPKSYEWSIEPLKVEIPKAEVTEFGYDGKTKIVEVKASELYRIAGNVAIDAGEYTAKVTLINTNNTCWSDGSIADKQIVWKITKKVVEKPQYTVGELIYTGAAQTGVTVASNEAYTISGTTTATKAGSYTATITLNKNYSWPDGKTEVIEIKWSIAKKKIEIPTANTGIVYNKSEQIGVNGGEGYTLSGTTKAINAGSYTATAILTDTNNTCWSDNTTDVKTINWSIAKATPTVTGIVNVTYYPNANDNETTFDIKNVITSVDGTFNYNNSSKKTTFIPKDTTNYNDIVVENAEVTIDNTALSTKVNL